MNHKRALIFTPAVLFGFAALLNLGGCSSDPSPSDTTGGTGGTGNGASGGTGATGGTGTAGSSGGTAGSAGSVAMAGTSAGGSAGTGSSKPFPTVPDCPNIATTLNTSCAKIGCHKGTFASAGLDLTPNDTFVSRVKDVLATHKDIDCGGGTTCVPMSCPSNVKLVDSSNAQGSWIMQKLNGAQNGCGDPMPAPSSGVSLSAADKACIESLVTAIAQLPP